MLSFADACTNLYVMVTVPSLFLTKDSVPCQKNAYYMMGPLCTQVMSRTERHRFYHFYRIEEKWEKGFHYHTLMEVLLITRIFAKTITDQEYTDQQLVDVNYHAVTSMEAILKM